MSEYFNPVGNLVDQQVSAVILKGRGYLRVEAAGGGDINLSLLGARKLRDWLNKAIPDERDAVNGETTRE